MAASYQIKRVSGAIQIVCPPDGFQFTVPEDTFFRVTAFRNIFSEDAYDTHVSVSLPVGFLESWVQCAGLHSQRPVAEGNAVAVSTIVQYIQVRARCIFYPLAVLYSVANESPRNCLWISSEAMMPAVLAAHALAASGLHLLMHANQ
jgi:hypothetical protein